MSHQPAGAAPIGATMPLRQKLALMYVLMLTMFLVALDQSIVATAIPRIVADLGGFQILSWIVTIYLLTSTVVIPIVGKLTDMFGRKQFLLVGIVVFTLASVASGLVPSMATLIAARGVQGIGAGIVVAGVFATLGDLFTPMERAKYFPFFIGMFTFAGLVGPTFGGFLTDSLGWRWCFYVNLPVGIAAVAFIQARLPAGGGTGGRVRDIDFLGTLLLTVATVALLLAIAWTSERSGWTSPQTLGLLGTAILFTGLFVLQEARHPQAIIPLSLFRNLPFMQSIAITLAAASCIFTTGQFLPTYVQISLDAPAWVSGVVLTPQGLGVFFTGLLTGRLIARTGRYKLQMVIGAFGLAALAYVQMTTFDSNSSELYVTALLAVGGLFAGLVMPVTQVIVQGAVSQAEQGVAASTRQFFLQIAQVVGVAVLGLLFTSTYSSSFESRSAGELQAALPPAAYVAFRDDATLPLDETRYTPVRAEVMQREDGAAILARTIEVQRAAVADGTERIFTAAFLAACFIFVVCLTLKEITLRRSFEGARPPEAAPVEV